MPLQGILPTSHPKQPTPRNNANTGPHTLTFVEEGWRKKALRLYKKAVCASNGDEASWRNNSSGEGSTDGDRGEAYQDYVRESAKEDEIEWLTDLTVVDRAGHDVSELDKTDQGTSEYPPRTSNTRDVDEHFVARIFGDGLAASIVASTVNFFEPRFADGELEASYQRERWSNHKPLAMAAVGFLYLNYILYLIFNRSETTYEYVCYYGLATIFTLPLPVLIAINAPRRNNIVFQIWISCGAFWWGVSELIQTDICNFWPARTNCRNKDFLFMMCYAVAMPVLVMFGCNMKRLYATIGSLLELLLICCIILPQQGVFVRNAISFATFMAAFIFLHYWMESVDRRMYILRAQLKIALKAQQKAQMLQKQASSSKRRFVSYIFHECRVPLNSAMLAFQNLQSNDAFRHAEKDQEVEIQALESSMSAMKQVLDDVLDLQRMDSGKFNLKYEPFPFNTIVRAILGPLKVATAAKGLEMRIELDPKIEELAERLQSSEDLWVSGDALRFRQVLSNLCSNAVKFTSSGSVTVRTILTSTPKVFSDSNKTDGSEGHQHVPDVTVSTIGSAPQKPLMGRSLSTILPELKTADQLGGDTDAGHYSIRIEVIDTGVGIKPSESSRLFSPFFQTRLGAMQGGKGSGLGIVTLSGGRLGVRSERSRGSTFWFELNYDIASASDIQLAMSGNLPPPIPQSPRPEVDSLAPHARFNFPETQGASTSSPNQTPRRTTVGWDPSLIASLSESGELRVPRRESLAARERAPSPRTASPVVPSAHATSDPYTATPPEDSEVLQPKVESTEHVERATMHKAFSYPSAAPPPTPPPVQSPFGELEGANLSVLCVDDDPLTRKLLSRMLERLGCTVTTAEDGKQALDILLGVDGEPPRRFDMISLDSSMPVMSGPEAVRALRKAGRSDFVLGATGNALKSDQTTFYEAGVDRLLAKPLLLRDIKEALVIAHGRRGLKEA